MKLPNIHAQPARGVLQQALATVKGHYDKIAAGTKIDEVELAAFLAASVVVAQSPIALAEMGGHVLNLSLREYRKKLDAIEQLRAEGRP